MPILRNLNLRAPSREAAPTPQQETEPRPAAPRPAKPSGALLLPLAAVLAAAAGLGLHYREQIASRFRPVSRVHVATAEVRPGTVEQTIRLTGEVVAERSVYLRAPYLRGRRSSGGGGDFGLVLEELAPSGKHVRKGEMVAGFDRLAMQNRLDDTRAARIESELNVATLQSQLEVSRAVYRQRVRTTKAAMDKAALDLRTAPVRSAIQVALYRLALEEGKSTYEAAVAEAKHIEVVERADRRLAELGAEESRVEERRAESNLDRMVIRAPVDGVFVVSEVRRGTELEQIRAGDQLWRGQPFAQVVDPGSMIVHARANQVDIERLRSGSHARVRFEAYPDLELPARVYSIAPLATGGGRRAAYVSEVPVFVKLERMDERLIPHLSVSADIVIRRESSEAVVPRAAVFQDAEGEQTFVHVRTPAGWTQREVQLGLADNIQVAIEEGVRPSEVVALGEPPARAEAN